MQVALLAEGVDRNSVNPVANWQMATVALLAEGVDRNGLVTVCNVLKIGSPSSRRAWIEIPSPTARTGRSTVALLAEGVDRNKKLVV